MEPEIDIADVGSRIARYRQRLGLSTQQLAERIGKSLATVSRIENSKQAVSLQLLVAIGKALRVHALGLLTDEAMMVSELLPPHSGSDQVPGILAATLYIGRTTGRLSPETVAQQLEISAGELGAIELGLAVPSGEALAKLAALYQYDREELLALGRMERACPQLSRRLGAFLHFCLTLCREMHEAGLEQSAERLIGLARLIDNRRFAPDHLADLLRERGSRYFSIAHLSDRLLEALQRPEFAARCEKYAEEDEQRQGGAATAATEGAPAAAMDDDALIHRQSEAFNDIIDFVEAGRADAEPEPAAAGERPYFPDGAILGPPPESRLRMFQLDPDDPMLAYEPDEGVPSGDGENA